MMTVLSRPIGCQRTGAPVSEKSSSLSGQNSPDEVLKVLLVGDDVVQCCLFHLLKDAAAICTKTALRKWM